MKVQVGQVVPDVHRVIASHFVIFDALVFTVIKVVGFMVGLPGVVMSTMQ
jgi:hypothetical protein